MAAGSSEENKLMYQPFSSILNPAFWQQLTDLKLNKLKLNTDPINIHGSYSCNLADNLPCLASFDHDSFKGSFSPSKSSSPLYGQLICTNIKQEFMNYNIKELLQNSGSTVWQSIRSGEALREPEKWLSRFFVIVHADLKKYDFHYLFAFPAVNYPLSASIVSSGRAAENGPSPPNKHIPISDIFNDSLLQEFQDQYDNQGDRLFSRAYFIVKHIKSSNDEKEQIKLLPLTKYKGATDGEIDCSIYFAYSEPCASQVYSGWPMRNFLCLIAVQFKLNHVKMIRVRRGRPATGSRLDIHHSLVVEVMFNVDPLPSDTPLITGLEKNQSNRSVAKHVNLSSLLDPKKLAEDAIDLNLKLMKWRLVPNLDLEKIANTRCLLLGCGTLGCHIARGLLAWGIKTLSIVDNAKISYSNPVRQTLYTFEDCTRFGGGSSKAETAVAALKKIHPSVNATAYCMSIPMPGHTVTDGEIEQTKADVSKLENLIDNHDVIFLLMDTRESRWLPTVMAISKQKLVINAAIGFDTFLLQRYGIRDYDKQAIMQNPDQTISCSRSDMSGDQLKKELPSDRLGCYFCNDIVAPGDSTQDRTLDQQCTVSRPGVSMMVSALAVELLASIMSSSQGPKTAAPLELDDPSFISYEDSGSDLGIVPHTIRGNLTRYHIYMPTCASFNKCSACSPSVIDAYRSSSFDFLLKVFNDPSYLEELTGLKDLQNVDDSVWALDSDGDDLNDTSERV